MVHYMYQSKIASFHLNWTWWKDRNFSCWGPIQLSCFFCNRCINSTACPTKDEITFEIETEKELVIGAVDDKICPQISVIRTFELSSRAAHVGKAALTVQIVFPYLSSSVACRVGCPALALSPMSLVRCPPMSTPECPQRPWGHTRPPGLAPRRPASRCTCDYGLLVIAWSTGGPDSSVARV